MKNDLHPLLQARSLRLLKIIFGVVLALTLLAGLFTHQHTYFGVEDYFGFYAAYGFFTCIAMVIVAKILGIFIKRPEDYYQGEESDD